MKDNFSKVSSLYVRFRPVYPQKLFDFIFDLLSGRDAAWDCGTGNGQMASVLADYFTKVFASDISENQIAHAVRKGNIYYSVQPVEHTSYDTHQFDLIIAAQAAHWFDLQKYYREVDRTLRRDGVLALVGYSHVELDEPIGSIIGRLKRGVLAGYWDREREYVDERYSTLPFPYQDIPFPDMDVRYNWTLEQLVGYLHTWSAVQHYRDQKNVDPVGIILAELEHAWGKAELREVTFPLFARIGKK